MIMDKLKEILQSSKPKSKIVSNKEKLEAQKEAYLQK